VDSTLTTASTLLAAIKYAEATGNISEACRLFHISRATFYKWLGRYQTLGEEGLYPTTPDHSRFPGKIPESVVEAVKTCSIEHPSLGCFKLAMMLKESGIELSNVSVQRILCAASIGSRHDRWLFLEDQIRKGALVPSDEQRQFIVSMNPRFAAYDTGLRRPGQNVILGVVRTHHRFHREIGYWYVLIDAYSGIVQAHISSLLDLDLIGTPLIQYFIPILKSFQAPIETISIYSINVTIDETEYDTYFSPAKEQLPPYKVLVEQKNPFISFYISRIERALHEHLSRKYWEYYTLTIDALLEAICDRISLDERCHGFPTYNQTGAEILKLHLSQTSSSK